MNETEIKNILRLIDIPPPSEKAKELAWEHSRIAFAHAPRAAAEAQVSVGFWRRIFSHKAMVCAMGILAGAIAVYLVKFPMGNKPQGDFLKIVAQEQKVLTEMTALFPNQLRAVVATDEGRQVVLADQPRQGNGQPVVIEIAEDGRKVRIVTFSGESIEVKIGAKQERFEILVTADHQVIVVGETFVWRSDAKDSQSGHHIQAQSLVEDRRL